MAKQKVLVPYNFTKNDEKAVDFVIGRFANDKNVEVTLLHAYTPVPDIDFRDNPIMEKMASNLTYLRQKIGEREAEMKAAGDRLLQHGFSADQVRYIFRPVKKDVTQDIIDLIGRGSKRVDICPLGYCDLDSHVSQPTNPGNTHLVSFFKVKFHDGRIGSYSGTQ